jgi:hypothetical protein
MKKLNRMRYHTMNSWNKSTAPAYNLKVYKVINNELQNKVYEMMDTDEFYWSINDLINCFNEDNEYKWQAGFNGRSGGYLVLYRGGVNENGTHFSYPGRNIDEEEIPGEVLRSFRRLAVSIVMETEYMAREGNITEEEYTVTKTRKVINY